MLPWPFSRVESAPVLQIAPAQAVLLGSGVRKRRLSLSAWLQHYEKPGVAPPSSRVDPLLQQREGHGIGIWDACKLGAVVALKVTEMAGDVLSHHIWGPRKKSWGIQMTIFTSLMRDAGRHSDLVDIATIRMFIALSRLVPLPPDALVTPVTFSVKKRGLRGILTQYDAQENGSRELSGEWVVSKTLWRRLQAEWKASRTAPGSHTPTTPYKERKERVILYLHGGAYYLFSPSTHRGITIQLSKFADARVFAIDYRLAPETRFPGPLHDAVATYFRLIDDLHIPPENILIAGDSAGGGLSLALLMYLRDNCYPLPAGAILMSPWVDLTMSCESWDSNAQYDIVPLPTPGDALDPIACYLGPHMEKYLTHPYASPLFGNFSGLPPMLIQSGEAEVLRDEVTLLAHKASLAGVEVRHELYEDATHVFQAFPFLDASHEAFLSCHNFVHNVLPLLQVQSPQVLDIAAQTELTHEIDNVMARVVRGDGIEKAATSINDPSTDDSISDSEQDVGDEIAPRTSKRSYKGHPMELDPDLDDDETSLSISRSSGSLRRDRVLVGRQHTAIRSGRRSSFHTHRHVRLTSLNMSTMVSAPTPTIRSSSSHPNIHSLCQQWERSGPANVTTTYASQSAEDGAQNSKPRFHRSSSFSYF